MHELLDAEMKFLCSSCGHRMDLVEDFPCPRIFFLAYDYSANRSYVLCTRCQAKAYEETELSVTQRNYEPS